MGFNTVVFLLNDMMHEVEISPKTATYLITHPDFSDNDKDYSRRRKLATEYVEYHIPNQALEVLPTFHADNMKIFLAGGNQIKELRVIRTGKQKDGTSTITVEAPEWLNKPGDSVFNLNWKPKR